MEDALALTEKFGYIVSEKFSLNPCCNGRCTRTLFIFSFAHTLDVLILVVMEDALALEARDTCYVQAQNSLNPCCNGRCTRTVNKISW